MTLRFGLLGTVEVWLDGAALPVPSGRTRLALAVLLLAAGRFANSDRLIDALWDDPPQHAKARLHNIIRDLRRHLGPDAIRTRSPGYELAGHELDLDQFRELVADAARARAIGDHAGAHTMLDEALALWRGPALADLDGGWARETRGTLTDERLAAVESRLDVRLDLERFDDVLTELTELVAEQPYREGLHARQLRALAGAARTADALAAYDRVHRLFLDDLGIPPGQELRDLARQLRRGKPGPAPTRPAVPAPTPVLTGRAELIGTIVGELRTDGDHPPVALLVGPGGIGKTTAALAAAQELGGAFPDGQLFLDLRGSHDPLEPHEALGRLLRMLGVTGAALPDDQEERLGLYRSRLAAARLLIVLDDAATERQVRPLLPQRPGCGAVLTSRRQLGALIGPVRLPVPVLSREDAITLLARISGATRTDAEPTAAVEVVTLCGHLPLAVRVAGARLAVHPEWTLADLAARLADARGRLDVLTMGDMDVRATFALSYQALDPFARLVFRRLGLLSTPDWPAWVAEELAGSGPVDRVLDQLSDAHLVEPLGRDDVGQLRFRLHDLISGFARERAVAEDGSAERGAAWRRLLSQWLALAGEADARVEHGMLANWDTGAQDVPARSLAAVVDEPVEWFEVERINLTTAVADACREGQANLAGRLALRLSGFLTQRSYEDDRERVLRQALAHSPDDDLLVGLLGSLWSVYAQRDQYAELPPIAEAELAAARRLGDRERELMALIHAGRSARLVGQFPAAVAWLDEALAVARHPSMPSVLLARAISGLAKVHADLGNRETAVALLTEVVALTRDDHARSRAMNLHTYGVYLTDVGRLADAEQALTEAHSLVTTHDVRGAAWLDQSLADVDIRVGRFTLARTRLTAALSTQEDLGDGEGTAEVLRSLSDLSATQGDFEQAAALAERALTIWRDLGSRLEQATTHARLTKIHHRLNNPTAATESAEKCRALLRDLGLTEASLRPPPPLLD